MDRIIHTDLYSQKAMRILTRLHYYMLNDWGSRQMYNNADCSEVTAAPNGELTWVVKKGAYRYCRTTYSSRTDNSIREWIACALKHVIYTELRRLGADPSKEWKRKNKKRVVKYLSTNEDDVTLAEAYCVFDKLLNRKTFFKRWPKKMINEIVGAERDPAETEVELARREEIAKINSKYDEERKALDKQASKEYYEVIKVHEDKFKKLRAELLAARDKEIADLNEALSFANVANGLKLA